MKKLIFRIIIPISLIIFIMNIVGINTKAYEINNVEYSYSTYELYMTQNDENYYRVYLYIPDNPNDIVLTYDNMTVWYNAIANINNKPHVYNFNFPIIFSDNTGTLHDGIYKIYIDYDPLGAASSNIIFMDLYSEVIGIIPMDLLTVDMRLIMIKSSILDPYNAGYEDGRYSATQELKQYYDPIIENNRDMIDYLNETIAIKDQYAIDYGNDKYDQGYNDGYNDFYDLGSLHFGKDINSSSDYIDGYNDGTTIDMDVKPFFQKTLDGIAGFFQIQIFPGMTFGGLLMIPFTFAIFKWFMKVFGK